MLQSYEAACQIDAAIDEALKDYIGRRKSRDDVDEIG